MATNEKAYELRALTADDMFPMFQIVTKIGFKEFKNCFDSPDVKEAIAKTVAGEEVDANSIGMLVVFDVVGIVVSNLSRAKEDIYQLLSQLSGMTKAEISSMPMAAFTQMIIDVVRKEEFNDFFQVVSKLFK